MNKRRILKGIDSQISNMWCVMTDYDLSNPASDIKSTTLKKMDADRNELLAIRKRLVELLT